MNLYVNRKIKEGKDAEPGQECPYGKAELKERCAWLAGHADKHGYKAAEEAADGGRQRDQREA